ncbi:MAG: TIGR02757 family protein [Crocinitomicaceae bacterium]
MISEEIKRYLDEKVLEYNTSEFIEDDPVKLPHRFNKKEDIEIVALLVATIAWGNRKSIIKNGKRLIELMEFQPLEFILSNDDFSKFDFVHRTFNAVDLDFFFRGLKHIYENEGGLEQVFDKELSAKASILNFRNTMFTVPHEKRSEKHLANPDKGSSAKRMNMFLRWMVRKDKRNVDFGIWEQHKMSNLYVPLDVHTGISARKLGLITRNANDWKALEELMTHLKEFCPEDPCKYDFALFGMSVNNELEF